MRHGDINSVLTRQEPSKAEFCSPKRARRQSRSLPVAFRSLRDHPRFVCRRPGRGPRQTDLQHAPRRNRDPLVPNQTATRGWRSGVPGRAEPADRSAEKSSCREPESLTRLALLAPGLRSPDAPLAKRVSVPAVSCRPPERAARRGAREAREAQAQQGCRWELQSGQHRLAARPRMPQLRQSAPSLRLDSRSVR